MQQHPVPQNVINFQFKLVGDMTLKQFGYLAGGAVAAFISSKLPYPAVFTYVLAGLFAFSGFALAFLPIEERPLDLWLKNFFFSIFSPTQFFYHKTGGSLDFLDIDLTRASQSAEIINKSLKKDKYQDYIKTLPGSLKSPIDLLEKHYVRSLDFAAPAVLPITQTAIQPTPLTPPLSDTSVIHDFQKAATLSLASIATPSRPFENIKVRPLTQEVGQETQFQEIKLGSLAAGTTKIIGAKEKYVAPKREIPEVQKTSFDYLKNSPISMDAAQKEAAERQKMILKKQEFAEKLAEIERKKKILQDAAAAPSETAAIPPKQTVSAEELKTTSQTPQTPKTANIVCGVVLDSSEKPIRGAIVEIKNEKNVTARTLKTNSIGQFTIATPLGNGSYAIFIEKEGYAFDTTRIILDNKIIQPIVVKCK